MTGRSPFISRSLFLLLGYITLVGVYWSLRYAGSTMEVDTMRVTMAAEGTLVSGNLIHVWDYHAGYGFQVLLAFVSAITGISAQAIQLSSGVWLFVVGLTSYVVYRELLGKPGLAILSAFLLFVQPDFLFYILRASHEKVTWLYALWLVFLAVRSARFVHQPAKMAIYILLFYLVFWGMAAGNTLFASSFIVALGISFIGVELLSRFRFRSLDGHSEDMAATRRLLISTAACLLVVFIIMEYVYPPASSLYTTLTSLVDRVSSLFLGAQPSEPYRSTQSAWLNPLVYLMLTAPQWLISILSFVFWVYEMRHLDATDHGRRMLWLMYFGFGVQLAFSILADFSGFLNVNLQVRQFTPFTLFSSPLAALLIFKGIEKTKRHPRSYVRTAIIVFVLVSVGAAMLKVTDDPLLGNQWLFYTPAELDAARWVDDHVRSQNVWLDTSSHLFDVLAFSKGYGWTPGNTYDYGPLDHPEPYVLISQLTRLKANRSGVVLPSTAGYHQVYDDGDAQFYHRRARTPFQR